MAQFELGLLDVMLLVASIAMSVAIGLYFTNKNKSIEAYMMGDRSLSVVPVAISLMTSCMSGLSMLGSSAELYYQGPSYSLIFVSIILCGPLIAYTVLPVFYRLGELSLHKYLEKRYGLAIKYLVSIIYIIQMIFYNSVVLYLPAMALQSIFHVSKFYSILAIGLMCVLYSGIGGLKAVVWTDFFQAALMYVSLIVVGVMGTLEAGGLGKVFENASAGHRLDLENFVSMDPTVRHTLFGILVGSTIKHIYLVGVNQVQMQRALSLPSLKHAQLAFVLCSIFTALISLLSTYMGLVMYSTYKSCDPYLAGQIPRRDAVIVHYVANRLNGVPGLRGIYIAGIFSATMSTLSSFANSMAALSVEDFIKPLMRQLGHKELNGKRLTHLAKGLATLFGLVCVLMAFVIDKANSRLLQATTTAFGAIGVPFLAAFALGVFTRFTTSSGLLVGLLVTLSLGGYITITQTFLAPPLEPRMPVYTSDQCLRVYNQTMNPSELPDLEQVFSQSELERPPAGLTRPFSLDQISYMTLPAIQFVLTILVSSLASLLTGGWSNQVNDECLVTMMKQGNEQRCFISNSKWTPSGPKASTASAKSLDRLAGMAAEAAAAATAAAAAAAATDTDGGQRRRKLGVVNAAFSANGGDEAAEDQHHAATANVRELGQAKSRFEQ